MSVINQMLKDLDERQNAQHQTQAGPAPIVVKTEPKKWLLIAIVVILLLNALGIFIWQLYSENKSLKAAHNINNKIKAQQVVDGVEQALSNKKTSQLPTDPSISNNQAASDEQALANKPVTQATSDANKAIAHNKSSQLTESAAVNEQQISTTQATKTEVAQQQLPQEIAKKQPPAKETAASLTISRKQLSAEELIAQKLNQAEQALNSNQLSDAERLFEEVLLIAPENKTARKQLAALWFGRKSYQQAVNLLSQGIALSPQDSEFRLMKARVYLSQGQKLAAVDTLKALADVENVEYQALLASNAQQVQLYTLAINSYALLTQMQPQVGRWLLGLAVAYDSNSEFQQALSTYNKVKDNNDISESARQFVRQRLLELGE